jgi:hypothetical protein
MVYKGALEAPLEKLGFAMVFAVCLAACSGSDSNKSSNSSESYSYDITLNNCPTGKHTFSSKEALCKGLKDDTLNDHCAREVRRQEFSARSCSGSFDEVSMQTLPHPSAPAETPDAKLEPTPDHPMIPPSQPGSTPQPQKPVTPKDLTAGWKQKMVVKSQKFLSSMDSHCSDFVCLTRRLAGNQVAVMDPNDPEFMVSKYSSFLTSGVLLECTRRTPLVSTDGIGEAICQLSVDPSQSTDKAAIEVSDKYSLSIVSIDLKDPKLVGKLVKATSGLLIISNQDEVAIVEKSSGHTLKVERMKLSCNWMQGKTTACKMTGVIESH